MPNASERVSSFARIPILVIGDVILDRYLWTDVQRASPEAPVVVAKLRLQTHLLGGAANVAANLAALGARPTIIGVIGCDDEADTFRELLADSGIPSASLIADPLRPTTLKTRVLSMGQQLLRIDREESAPLGPAAAKALLAKFRRALPRARMVVLSDYDKGVLAPALCRQLIDEARAAGKPVIVDPKALDYSKYRGATLIKPNKSEAQAASGIAIGAGGEGLEAAARALLKTTRAESLVITRGGAGVSLFEARKKPVHIPAQARSIYDVTGAGDTFLAAMALALAAGAPLAQAAEIGNAASGIVVGKVGAAVVEPAELQAALDGHDASHKLVSRERLQREVRLMRAAGKRIVFTNGCFDLIHLGHLKFLERARQLGDALIVAINSDAGVRALKGPPRPIIDQQERAALLSALDAVDYVVVFDEPTPEALLKALKPDVLVKGKDLKESQIVGADFVKSYGGQVDRMPMLGKTTTEGMLSRMVKKELKGFKI